MKKSRHVTVSLDDETYEKVAKISKEEDRPTAAVIRRIVEKALKAEEL